MEPTWHIQLLGGWRIQRGEQTITRMRTLKTQYLLAYLALFPERRHAREELIELFWGDADPESGRMSLRSALSALRHDLEPDGIPPGSVLVADRTLVSLNNEQVTTDLREFQAALQQAGAATDPSTRRDALRRAVALYGGPLLPGCYEDWALRERERLQERYIAALRGLASALEAQGEWQEAMDCLHKAIGLDPLLEEAYRDLIRGYLALGQPAAARRQYQTLDRVLREELGAAPSPETRRLLEEIPTASVGPVTSPARPSGIPPQAGDATVPPSPAPALPAHKGQPAPLPPLRSRFFGREAEMARLIELLQPRHAGASGPQIVTLTGPGGSGKTRLALEMAHRLRDAYDGAVWFVSLAVITEARLLPNALLAALRPEYPVDGDALEPLAAFLATAPVLLVLDNLEQLLDDRSNGAEVAAHFLQSLCDQVPTLTCLVTSRQRLELAGEREIALQPLPVPPTTESPETLLTYPAIALFVDRAQEARPDFQLNAANAEAVRALCAHLDGIPLALELAAAWSVTLTPAQIQARLERGLELLRSARKDLPARHQTLRAAIEWSYRLLTPEQQRFFAQLSVFRGGWTLEAAEAVVEIAPWVRGLGEPSDTPLPGEEDAPAYLRPLQQRSLVRAEEAGGEMRYRLLETLREFADAQLSADERVELRTRHLRYFRALAVAASAGMNGPQQGAWLDRVQRERENFRAALEWSRETPENAWLGLEIVTGLRFFYNVRGLFAEGYALLTDLLARTESLARTDTEALDVLSRAWMGVAELALSLGDFASAQSHFERALTIDRQRGYQNGIAYTLCYLGLIADHAGDTARAAALYTESLAIWRALNDSGGICHTLKCMGENAMKTGDFARADALLGEGLTLAHTLGKPRNIISLLGALGELRLAQGDAARAADLLQQHLAIATAIQDAAHVAYAQNNLGRVAVLRGDVMEARTRFEQALALRRELGDRFGIALTLTFLADLAAEQGDLARSRALYRETLQILQGLGDRFRMGDTFLALARLAERENDLERSAFLAGAAARLQLSAESPPADTALAAAWQRAQALPLEDVLLLACR